ncbi:Metallo-dependent hydrolase [Karstenula rhodostoma CBS 690.94]|uniref:Metallo-dependent hydrolase n=1 Tax=Karstenula rhodostoma CBS 690.94 TaxID=1392251 RepID=A0A9P4P559_9PLEO|nr:Metallo-dependent hydrolase [Karstenula rhodostoma CBS 690.94]
MASTQPQNRISDKNELETYLETRNALIRTEAEEAWDYAASTLDLAPNEKVAADIIRLIREFERRNVFGNMPSEDIPPKHALDMGGQFLTNKTRIEKRSILFQITKKVPKGALLHLHFNAELNPERLLEQAREMGANMYVWSIRPLLTEDDLRETEIVFKIVPSTTKDSNIFDSQYEGRGKVKGADGSTKDNWRHSEYSDKVWMRWETFRATFKKQTFARKYKGEEKKRTDDGIGEDPVKVQLDPAENWILSKMVLSETEAYDPSQTVNGVWARFNQATRCFKGLLNYKKVYEWYISKAIDRMIDEKVMYAELRPMLLDKFIEDDDGGREVRNAEQMRLIQGAVAKKHEELKKANKEHLFPFGLKIIYCTPRSIPEKIMEREINDCIELKLEFPNLICGFDLVGAEDRPNHIGFYHKQLTRLQKECKEKNIEIPFMFHAGETLLDTGGSSDPQNSNLYDAVALKSKRIGHGFALMKHPHLVEKFKRTEQSKGICIELCPISNELLHLCRNIKEHPYPELLAAGIPCCVNSDNPSLFSNSMSHEFYQIMVGSPTMSVHSWKQLALWSLEYSCLEDEEKNTAEGYFRKAWGEFCDWVVEEYGDLFNFSSDGNVQTLSDDRAEERYERLRKLQDPID